MNCKVLDPERFSSSKRLGTAALVLCLGLAFCSFVPGVVPRAAAQQNQNSRSDSEIQADVAYALTTSAALKGQHITAATIEGDVTLSGNVSDAASKELAESMVVRLNGVRSVTNNLAVGSAPAAQGPDQAQEQQGPSDQSDPNQGNPNQGDPNQGNPNQPNPGEQQAPPPPDQGAQGAPPPPDQYPGEQGPPDQANRAPQQQYPPRYDRGNYPPPPEQASGPVTIPAGTLLRVRSSETLDSKRLQPGNMFEVTVASDIYAGSVLAIPRGAVLDGVVVDTRKPSGLSGSPLIALQLKSLNLEGRSYQLNTDVFDFKGPNKAGYSAQNTIGGAAVGAVIGAIVGRGPGAAIGAVAGGATGAAASAATSGPRLIIPAEAVVNFHLAQPVTVQPVSYREAQRLASADSSRYPRLQQRAGYRYPPPPPLYYYPYGYPYPYRHYYGW